MAVNSCPHYAPSAVGNPTFVCPGCASLVADHRHPQNQANGLKQPTFLAAPSARTQPKSPFRQG